MRQAPLAHQFFVRPVLVDGTLYVTAGDTEAIGQTVTDALYAVRASDGSQVWHSQTWGSQILPTLFRVNQGVVFAATAPFSQTGSKTMVSALRATDGSPLWQSERSDIAGDLVAAGGQVYPYNTVHGGLDALRASDGATIWNYQAQDQESAVPTLHVFADAERVYLANTFNNSGFEAASLEVRNGADGKVLWRYPYQRQYALFTLMNGVVYIGSSSSFQPAQPEAKKGSVCAFQASTGAKFWCLQTTTHVFRLTIGG